MVHGHPVVDTDKHFIIDSITRSVTNAESAKNMLMQNDHNSERFTFEIDKEIEGHDMSLCDKVQIHYNNIEASSRKENTGVYEVTDLEVSTGDPTKLVFTWLVSGNSTKNAGSLNFLIAFMCTEDTVVTYKWHSNINTSISITKGMNNGDDVVEEYADILLEWERRLFGIGDTVEAQIEAKGKAVLESINFENVVDNISTTYEPTWEVGVIDSDTGELDSTSYGFDTTEYIYLPAGSVLTASTIEGYDGGGSVKVYEYDVNTLEYKGRLTSLRDNQPYTIDEFTLVKISKAQDRLVDIKVVTNYSRLVTLEKEVISLKEKIDSLNVGGVSEVTSDTQPTDQAVGDYWCMIAD